MQFPSVTLHRLAPADVPLLRKLNALFGDAFAEPETYTAEPPSDAYLEGLLAKEHVVALVALAGEEVLGGLVAYELDKFERARREFYIYDLAVAAEHRRRRIATALIEHLREIAARRGAWVIYVQADYGDDPAIALYGKFGFARTWCTSTSVLNRRLPSRNGSTVLALIGFAPRRVVVIKIERKSSSKLPSRTLHLQSHGRSLPFVSPSVAPFHESLERLATDGTARD